MDYLVTEGFTVPAGSEHLYSEKLIRMPGFSQPHDGTQAVAAPHMRRDYRLPETGFIFCSFNYAQKITPEIFATWMEILKAVPDSVLWLRTEGAEVLTNLRAEAARAGFLESRLVFTKHTPELADHLARYRVAGLALDTFPYNSHTTGNDALGLGCPLVTLAGESFAARFAGGMLHALGLPELVTNTLADYRDMAVRLATQPEMMADVKARLAAASIQALHFNAQRFTRRLEAGFLEAWSIHARGEAPRHIMVPPS
jgi:protein O-GlcNAc transferase